MTLSDLLEPRDRRSMAALLPVHLLAPAKLGSVDWKSFGDAWEGGGTY